MSNIHTHIPFVEKVRRIEQGPNRVRDLIITWCSDCGEKLREVEVKDTPTP